MASDLIAASASEEYDLPPASKRLLSMIYKKVAEHRDALGYPEGSNQSPYFMISNDLSLKFAMCLKLMLEADVKLERDWILELTREYVASYDEHHGSGCCGLYHSQPKETAEAVLAQFVDAHNRGSAAKTA